jgi:carboxylesterase type B
MLSYLGFYLLFLSIDYSAAKPTAEPTVQVKNGTYIGRHVPNYNQDLFLGLPYAQPPVGDLRYRVPSSLNTTWNGSRPAQEYSSGVST